MNKLVLGIAAIMLSPVSAAHGEATVAELSAALGRDCNAKYNTTQGMKVDDCLQTIARALQRILDDADTARSKSGDAVDLIKAQRK
jgi:hypothetical protein